MTDARFPDRWLSDRRFARLSDGHFRSCVTSLAWSVTNRTDGVIEPEDLSLIPNFAKDALKSFIGNGLWMPRAAAGRGWLITDFEATQTTAAQLQHLDVKRAKERDKKARQRAAAKLEAVPPTSTNDAVPGDIPGAVPTENTGKARTGKDQKVTTCLPQRAPKTFTGSHEQNSSTGSAPERTHTRSTDDREEDGVHH